MAQVTSTNVELATVTKEAGYRVYTAKEVEAVLERIKS
jgi:hypothetical protein